MKIRELKVEIHSKDAAARYKVEIPLRTLWTDRIGEVLKRIEAGSYIEYDGTSDFNKAMDSTNQSERLRVGWRDIATCPKANGFTCLLYYRDESEYNSPGEMAVGTWSTAGVWWNEVEGDPTHWMPLPQPPDKPR